MPEPHRPIDFAELAVPFPAAREADWRLKVAAVLKGEAFETLVGHTADNIPIGPLYPRCTDALPIPGMRPAKPWVIAARVDQGEVEAANAQALDDLENGAGALRLVFSGSLAARGFGLPLGDVERLDEVLANVDLNFIELHLESGTDAIKAARLVQALVERRNLSADTLSIDFGLDPIGSSASAVAPAAGTFDDVASITSMLREAGYKGPFLRCDGRPWHEAGASEAQELAGLIATGIAYLRLLEGSGLSIDQARTELSFLAVADADQFLTIAKFRAARRLWARVEAACGLEPKPIRLAAETAWRMLTKRDVNTNLLRNTIAVFGAAVGGADSISCLPFTAAHGLPDAFARRTARNIQAVLMEEAHLWRVSDPAAGAGGFEAMTDALCEEAWSLVQTIERGGGMAGLGRGGLRASVAATAASRSAALREGKATLVGTTRFTEPNIAFVPVLAPAGPTSETEADLRSIRLSEAFEDADGAMPSDGPRE